MQQGLCQKERPLDNSLCSDRIEPERFVHSYDDEFEVRDQYCEIGYANCASIVRSFMQIVCKYANSGFCIRLILLLDRLCNKDCAKRKDLWTTVFVPIVSLCTVMTRTHMGHLMGLDTHCLYTSLFKPVAHTSLQEASTERTMTDSGAYS